MSMNEFVIKHSVWGLLFRCFLGSVSVLMPLSAGAAEESVDLKVLAGQIAQRVNLSPEEQAWIGAGHTVRFRTVDNPPYQFDLKAPKGISVDYAQVICGVLKIDCDFIPNLGGTFAEAWTRLGTPEGPDAILTARRTPSRQRLGVFTREYLFSPFVILTRNDGAVVLNVDGLQGKRVLVEKGFLISEMLRKDVPGIQLLERDGTPQALLALASAEGDAYVGDLSTATFLIDQMGLSNIKIAAPTPFPILGQSMVVRKDWAALGSAMDKVFKAMSVEENQRLNNRWLSIRFDHGVSRNFAIAVSITALLLLAILIVYWRLHVSAKREIDARSLLEKSLQRRQLMMERTENLAHLASFEWEVDTNVVTWSPEMFRIFGRDPALGIPNLEGQVELYTPQSTQLLFDAVGKAVSDGTPYELELMTVQPDGEQRACFVMGFPERDASGRVIRLAGLVQDITERKQKEEKLLLAASVFSHAREGIIITNADGTIIDVNEAFTRITGFSREDAIGQNPLLLKSVQHDPDYYAAMWADLLSAGYWDGELWSRRKNGELFAELVAISAVRDNKGNTRQYVALFSDITVAKEHQSWLEHVAHFDALTNLPNRSLLTDRLQQAMAQALRRQKPLAVAFVDLDGFKAINDQHGHDAGDQVLDALAKRMKDELREGDTLARIGGDEFVAVLIDLDDTAACLSLLKRMLTAVEQPVMWGDLGLQVSASIGVTFYPQADEVDAKQLIRQADQSMYRAKIGGKNRYHIFDSAYEARPQGYREYQV